MSLGGIFASQFRSLRRKDEKSQEWLASQVNLARGTITKWEKDGAGNATLNQVESIAKVLKTSVGELLGINTPQDIQQPQNKNATDDSITTEIVSILSAFNESQKRGVLRHVESIKRVNDAATIKGKEKKVI